MKLRYSILLFVALTAIAQAIPAADNYVVAGAGAASCGKWLEARAANSESLNKFLTAWVQGFLSGMNAQRTILANKDMSLIPDPPTLLAYVDKYCRDNPLKSPYEASLQLYGEISKP